MKQVYSRSEYNMQNNLKYFFLFIFQGNSSYRVRKEGQIFFRAVAGDSSYQSKSQRKHIETILIKFDQVLTSIFLLAKINYWLGFSDTHTLLILHYSHTKIHSFIKFFRLTFSVLFYHLFFAFFSCGLFPISDFSCKFLYLPIVP